MSDENLAFLCAYLKHDMCTDMHINIYALYLHYV